MKKYPVTEIFGPTIQGEGIDQGTPCYFVRFGGCDFACDWCDTPHAVLPEMVRMSKRMSDDEILDALSLLPRGPSLIVLSGGNPVLHELGALCERIHGLRDPEMRISVETQGTRYKNWLLKVDRLCLSPKPPSSGMKFAQTDFLDLLERVVPDKRGAGRVFIKVVVFDYTDYEWAVGLHSVVRKIGHKLPFFLSAGNDAGRTVGNPAREDDRTIEQVRTDLLSKYLWLINHAMIDPRWNGGVTVQAQAHVLAWGNKVGV